MDKRERSAEGIENVRLQADLTKAGGRMLAPAYVAKLYRLITPIEYARQLYQQITPAVMPFLGA